MLLMNGYLRKAQHDENNLNIEVTVEVISDFKVKKASVFNGFKRQTTKSTASKPPAARLSSPSADPRSVQTAIWQPPVWAAAFLRGRGALPRGRMRRDPVGGCGQYPGAGLARRWAAPCSGVPAKSADLCGGGGGVPRPGAGDFCRQTKVTKNWLRTCGSKNSLSLTRFGSSWLLF